MYIDKKVQRGYNAYMEMGHTDCNTNMDVGLLVMEEGDVFELCEAEKEVAYDLLQGKVEFAWDDQVLEADRPDPVSQQFCAMNAQIDLLNAKIKELEGKLQK